MFTRRVAYYKTQPCNIPYYKPQIEKMPTCNLLVGRGTSSFGDMAVVGGTGADQTSDGRNAIFTNTANAVAVGSIPGGAPTIVTAAGALTAYSTAGGGGFVLVEW